jgi:UDP-N-acetylmuramyl pentapeptide phosphotransferase/UDP-N-acetylglucosamine-1-phosphate transferase
MSEKLTILIAAGASGIVVALAEPATIRLLRRVSAMDTPNSRSSHTVPTPRGGGAPIAAGLVIAALLIRGPAVAAFAIAVAAFSVIGFADDLSGNAWRASPPAPRWWASSACRRPGGRQPP